MKRLFSLLMIGAALAVSGCGFLPFFSSDETVRNPVPKPDAEQTNWAPDEKSGKSAEKETTPSLVMLPENRRNINAVAPRERKVADTTRNSVFTGLGECLNMGYALLDGADCSTAAEKFDEPTSVVDSQNDMSAALDTDLLGNRTIKEPIEISVETAEKIEAKVNVAETPSLDRPSPTRALIENPIKPPARVVITPQPPRLIPAGYERIVLPSDVLFQFTKFELDGISAAGQLALRGLLDRFAQYEKTSLRKVIITGHSDRLGDQSTNLTLSERRAFSIKAFLVYAGIDADILETAGVGSVSPVKHCAGKMKPAELKSCLAPNRRVEIEIIGVT